MRYALIFAILLLSANGPALAQADRPQLVWEGEVSGGATLFIQGDRVDVQGRDTGSVDRPTYRFRDPLPAVRQQVRVEVRQGSGRVNIVEQPAPRNDFATVVDIRNNGRPDVYRLAFYWSPDNNTLSRNRNDGSIYRDRNDRDVYRDRNDSGVYRDRNDGYVYRGRNDDRTVARGGAGQMTWSGRVDDEAFIVVRGRRAETTTVRGQNVYGERVDFTAAMPRGNVMVNLVDARGRGQIELVDQPNANNNYSARIRITDRDGGAGDYAFTLAWDDGSGSYNSGSYPSNDPYYRSGTSSGGVLTPSGGGVYDDRNYPSGTGSYGSYGGNGVRWSGRVDGTLRVFVRGNQVWSQNVSGAPVYDERASVGTPLPRTDFRDVDVNKISGRGDVDMVQRPDRNNNYTLVFEIEDKSSGADRYEVEVLWR